MPIRHIGIIAIITAIGIIDIGTGGNSYWGQIAMPWTAEEAERHTKKADSPKRQRMWAEIANSVLADTGDEGRAIREANAAVAREYAKYVSGGDQRD